MKHNDLVIPEDGTDAFVNCKLDRRQYADVLTSIVSSYADGFVLAINNKWGTGKTTFVKMWRQDLKNKGYQTLYFNAWENDFQPEVMVALLAELSELRNKANENFKSVVEKSATFLKKSAPAIVKGLASKAIGNEAIGDVMSAFTEITTEQLETEIKKFTDSKKGIIDFREALEAFVKKVDNEKPVIFIVDELDRCRPDYAVSVLEEIKHLFSVSGIVFVLSIDKEQLGYAVRGVYGSEHIDSEEYLRRFIDLEYSIPKLDAYKLIQYFLEYFGFDEFLNSKLRKHNDNFQTDYETLSIVSKMLFSQLDLPIRHIEKCFVRIRLVLRTFKENDFVYPDIVVFLCFLKERHLDFYEKVQSTAYSLQDFVTKLDEILFPLMTSTDKRRFEILYASILIKYKNQYISNNYGITDELIAQDKDGKNFLNVKSEFNEQILLNNLYAYERGRYNNYLELSTIQKRYNLTESIKS